MDDKASLQPVQKPSFRPPLSRTLSNLPAPTVARLKKTTGLESHFLKSHGRPPWYGEDGNPISDAFVIGIAGGSASGKTHVARQIVQSLGSIPTVIILSQDSFYKKHDEAELALAFANKYDFDHPDALDMQLFASCLEDLKKCRQTHIPVYSFTEHQRLPRSEDRYLYGATVIIAEGIMALLDPTLRNLYDLKVFVQCDSDLMLARRIRRDVKERGRTIDGVLDQYLRFVKPAYDNFVLPTSRHADIIVPGSDNEVAIDLISTHIRRQLADRARSFRPHMVPSPSSASFASSPNNALEDKPNFILMKQTPQLKGIYTILRDRTTSRQDFIFFVDRLATYLVEKAMEYLPHKPKTVTTPVEVEAHGQMIQPCCLCGVSILRAGGLLERGLSRVIPDVTVGSLLVQSDTKTGEPLLLHTMLPECIRNRERARDAWVFLLDAQVGTAASAFMAIRVLLDHGVQPGHIILITFLVARNGGIPFLQRAFPDVKIVTGAIDDGLREVWLDQTPVESDGPKASSQGGHKAWVVEPGLGQMGDRYYLS
ncbi:armadillo/beta-catenin/plakoglobin [Punctularia strigosozonata HHB-11173 SS5]|uniref:Uridine kinase n=1 Tax=Punctularia strigosozonata (strain HHB-11173) TaxID=741275 RepID=R7S5Q9_PUNST|nr:armadillo/beta-catenin/plakoglobin [Punctularia strigosozonata HHB-11173 SS5]EIN04896.1 armadillo/beta-catenin/plakoglobin [Punctularia strigosozonata HHB-11173 SS5]